MLTKQQKIESVGEAEKILDQNKTLVFVDFSGTKVEDLRKLKRTLKEFGSQLKIIKKKLLRIAFQNKKIDFNPEQFDFQLGAVFSDRDISEVSGPVYKFFKEVEKKGFKILGAYDLSEKNFLDAETVKKIGQLPSREILLAQLIGAIASPIRMLMYMLQERGKKVG
ncbi:MAG: 50S ribosomal protein L10 [bacterium]|nr:50S ribosomal protein L10 [bacterium]